MQIEALMKTVQEGCHTIVEAVVKKKMKARGPVWPQGKAKSSKTPAAAYNVQRGDVGRGRSLQCLFHCSGWDDQHLLPYVFRSLQGFPGDLVRSLGEDTTQGDVLQMLDEHYDIVMTFDALSKELYSLKQGIGNNVAEFRVCLLQQVKILQTEYPSRFQQEHVEEVKPDCSYEGLNPEYQWMLVHKVDGKNPATYFKLLLAAQKLERWAEARYPLLLKTTTTRGLNMTHSHSQGNLFHSRKLNGSHTFTAQSAVVEDHETEEDSGLKPNGENEAESSAEEGAGLAGKVGGTDQSLVYIIWLTNTIELYQKNCNCFRCGSPHDLVKDCPKDLVKWQGR